MRKPLFPSFEMLDRAGHSRDPEGNTIVDPEIAKTCKCIGCSVRRFHAALEAREPWAVNFKNWGENL